ncbi:hypothetical protein QL285_074469 [Trifolium repens]|jgi:hypothetical protein|nr:hypothetical protein QL285_074469 [Trifolium repens]
MKRNNTTQKGNAATASEPKRRGRKKLSPEEARQSIDKMLATEIGRFVEEGKRAKEKAKGEQQPSESDTDSDYAEFLKTYDPDKKTDTLEETERKTD